MIMNDTEKYLKALGYASRKHDGQYRKGGEPYIIHPIAVSVYARDKGLGIDYQITGLFHDLLEDTDATEQEILEYSNEKVLEAVKLLTKTDGYVMAEYIDAIKKNDIAFQIKAADRLHNLRSAYVTSNEFKRKYILETVDWFLDFSDDIKTAVKELAQSLDEPMTEMSFLYEPIDSWKL